MRVPICLLQFAIACCVLVECNKGECGGYGKTQWSMSMKEVQGIYKDLKLVSKEEESTIILSHNDSIEGVPIEVRFIFSSNKLVVVNLNPLKSNYNKGDLEKIRKIFFNKYGKPKRHSKFEIEWETKVTGIVIRGKYLSRELSDSNYVIIYQSKEYSKQMQKQLKESLMENIERRKSRGRD